jgi:Ca2+-transporting ATPase
MSDFQITTIAKEQKGLTAQEAEKRIKEYGENKMPETPPPSDLQLLFSQLKSPLVYILLIAGLVTFFLREYSDTTVIALAVMVNTVFGFLQERKAGKALEALKKMVHPLATVIRDGNIQEVPVELLVPGDVALLKQGDKVPADGKVNKCNRLYVTEAMLTGESVPVEKQKDDKLYMGTVITSGAAEMLVKVTGANTEMGKIAKGVSTIDEETPLGKQITKFSKQLSVLVFVLVLIVFVIGLLVELDFVDIFETSVALAVSAIPEGLLVGLTVVLAIGMQRILKRRGLVRHLVSAETLGGVTTICVDKTGTLTEGKMQVADIFGNENEIANQVILANDLDDPIVIASWEWGKQRIDNPDQLLEKHKRLDSIPFSSDTRVFASLNRWNDEGNMVFVNGAPEELLERTTADDDEKKRVLGRLEQYSKEGKRILGFARKTVPGDKDRLVDEDVSGGFEWLGILTFNDPVRTDVRDALEKTRDAGIKLIVITGDYAKTALSVLSFLRIDVPEENIIVGEEIEKLSDEALEEKITSNGHTKLFARTKPEQKLKIVNVLKKHGEVVAMMGDGVNDAPALAQADIGIVVGEATDVAKESADLVLLDSSFSTIVAAVEEGRGIFDNIRKIVLYLMSDAFEEILIVLATLAFGLELPITAAQILWVNLVSDGFPHLALTVDPKSHGIMQKPPRSPKEPLVASWMYELIGIVSVIGGIFAFLLYFYVYKTTGDITLARSVTFATVGINSLVYVFSIKTLREPFWEENMFANRWLIGAVFAGLFFQLLPFVSSLVGDFIDIVSIGWYWVLVLLSSVLMFVSIEVSKWFFKHTIRGNKK